MRALPSDGSGDERNPRPDEPFKTLSFYYLMKLVAVYL